MWSKYILPIVSAIGLVLGIIAVIISRQKPPTPPVPFTPATSTFKYSIAGEGLVEASSEDISIGTPFTGIVENVFVEGGDLVKKGTPLFKLNTQNFEAQLSESKATLAIAEAEYQKQLALPRPEDVAPYESRVKAAQSTFMDKSTQYELIDKLENPKAVSRDEYNQRKYAAITAKYALEESEEELNKILSGPWALDLEIYRAQVKEAKAKIDSIAIDIERSTIRAPLDGYVFRVDIKKGELAQAAKLESPLLLFGSIDPLHIRVDIDEEDVWRVLYGAPGIAYVRGNSSLSAPLKYVRLEPYLVPKRSLTGQTTEQVDTRVLQIIYELDRKSLPIFPGMLMDVFLEAKPSQPDRAKEES